MLKRRLYELEVEVSLARAPQDISLLDIYLAIEDHRNLLHIDDKTNPLCIVGGQYSGNIRRCLW